MRSLDIYSAVVTSVPFLLLGVLATETKVFGPNSIGRASARRFDAFADVSALGLLAVAFAASVIELLRGRDDNFPRALAGYGLGVGALIVFGHVGMHVGLLYRRRPAGSGMIDAMTFLAHGELLVIETESDRYIGTAEVVDDQVIIRSGLRGHPTSVPLVEVVRVTPAAEHEDLTETPAALE